MQAKSSAYGSFWGCPRYPNCTGKRKMSPEYLALVRQQK
jgi:ssDNA-binding Zn-finger/Zn-ribbon topoisomerase 1